MIPLPRGMSHGFYAFMAAGAKRNNRGEILMIDPAKSPDHYLTHAKRKLCFKIAELLPHEQEQREREARK